MTGGPRKRSMEVASATTMAALELGPVLRLVAAEAGTDLGRERIAALRPIRGGEELDRRRVRYEEVGRLLPDGALVPSLEAPLTEHLVRVVDDGPVNGLDLLAVADLLRTVAAARRRAADAEPVCAGLEAMLGEVEPLDDLAAAIRRALDRRGQVRDDASPELERLRRRVRQRRDAAYGELKAIMERHRGDLSEETIPSREGRLVLVLQAGARGRLAGLTHGRSGRGKSFFYEPLEVVEANNELQRADEETEIERRRIFQKLVESARLVGAQIEGHAHVFADLDALQAANRWAELAGARLAEIGERQALRLATARHPLLDPALAAVREAVLGTAGHRGPIVPLEIDLGPDACVLVVTGPNAGGKSVALKTVGLASLLHQCGLPVPAGRGTRLPTFERIVAVVGDEQDLLAERSTFSGRLLRWQEVFDAASPEVLVLVDEVGSGTDPEEGEALASALLEVLVERGPVALLTTHLGAVAGQALELDGASCAAMAVDPESGVPRFTMQPGPPGASAAIELAERLGLPEDLLARARRRISSSGRDYRRRLEEVERLRQHLDEESVRLATEREGVTARLEALSEATAALEAERQTVGRRLGTELAEFRRRVRDQLRAEVERLASEAASGRRAAARESLDRLFAEAPEVSPREEVPPGPVRVGERVRHRSLGWEGTLDRAERGRAVVDVRGKRVRCRVDELAPVPAVERAVPRARPPIVGVPVAPEIGTELNLIGQRVEPALERIDAYLDRALLAGSLEVRIVHGHGSGRLRTAVREHLRTHPAVESSRPGGKGEGGNGATVVVLGD